MTKPAPDLTPKFKIACPCGWTQTFSRGYSGLEIECEQCGRRHRIPMIGVADAEADNEARAVMEKLINSQPYGQPAPGAAAEATVRLKPLFLLSAVVCALAVVAALVFFHDKPWPMAVVIIGGAASWPLGLWVAWLGQRRQSRLARQNSHGPATS